MNECNGFPVRMSGMNVSTGECRENGKKRGP